MDASRVIVVDIGKTLSKISLWGRAGEMLDRQVRPNAPIVEDGLRRLDVAGIGEWLSEALARYAGENVGEIVPVGHGAGFVAIVGDSPAFAPLDYEQAPPAEILAAYRRERDPFAVTGSPALPDGLNLGAQLHWLESRYPAQMREAIFVPWAQYWAWFLSGVAVSEATSLGCHTDLWCPFKKGFSLLAERRGWAGRFAPVASAGDRIGHLRAELAEKTGLSRSVAICAGLHDSNAALHAARGFAALDERDTTVLSTGTWFIAMRPGAPVDELAALPEGRDCLINVDVFGEAVASARFMGGREIESLIEIDTRQVDIKPDQPKLVAAVPKLVEDGAMMLPTLAPGCGPFPAAEARWEAEPADWFARRAAACLYAALVADAMLDLVGAKGALLIEGRFAEAEVFVRALASLRPETTIYTANAHNDVSFGALRLLDPSLRPGGGLARVAPLDTDIVSYKGRWYAAMAERVA